MYFPPPDALASRNGQKRPRSVSVDSDSSWGSIISTDEEDMNDRREDGMEGLIWSGMTKETTEEKITIDTHLKDTNKGMQMLLKMGWSQGTGLGASGQGRVDPIPHNPNVGFMGLGKASLENRMLNETGFRRRDLESERQALEGEEERKKREEAVKKKEEVKEEIRNTLKAFHCELCDKGYKNVTQYNEHLNSYDHHHKARFVELKRTERAKAAATGELAKQREKERRREAKELARLMGGSRVTAGGFKNITPIQTTAATSGGGGGFKAIGGFKAVGTGGSGGFKPLDGSSSSGGGGFKPVGGGFKAVGNSTSNNNGSTSTNAFGAPAFRSAGYKHIDLDSSGIVSSNTQLPHPPPPSVASKLPSITTVNNVSAPLLPPSEVEPPKSSSLKPMALSISKTKVVDGNVSMSAAMDMDAVEMLLDGGKPKVPKIPKKVGGWQAWKNKGK